MHYGQGALHPLWNYLSPLEARRACKEALGGCNWLALMLAAHESIGLNVFVSRVRLKTSPGITCSPAWEATGHPLSHASDPQSSHGRCKFTSVNTRMCSGSCWWVRPQEIWVKSDGSDLWVGHETVRTY